MSEENITIDEVSTNNEALEDLLEGSPTEKLKLAEEDYLWINGPLKGKELI